MLKLCASVYVCAMIRRPRLMLGISFGGLSILFTEEESLSQIQSSPMWSEKPKCGAPVSAFLGFARQTH